MGTEGNTFDDATPMAHRTITDHSALNLSDDLHLANFRIAAGIGDPSDEVMDAAARAYAEYLVPKAASRFMYSDDGRQLVRQVAIIRMMARNDFVFSFGNGKNVRDAAFAALADRTMKGDRRVLKALEVEPELLVYTKIHLGAPLVAALAELVMLVTDSPGEFLDDVLNTRQMIEEALLSVRSGGQAGLSTQR